MMIIIVIVAAVHTIILIVFRIHILFQLLISILIYDWTNFPRSKWLCSFD